MSLKNFCKIFVLSFYSKQLYLAISEVWQNWGLKYLLNLSLLLTTISNSAFFISLYYFNLHSPQIIRLLDQIPKFSIVNNAAQANDYSIKYPVRIKADFNKNQDLIIVDFDTINTSQYKQNVIVLTKDRIAFNFMGTKFFDITYSELFRNSPIIELNTDTIIALLELLKRKVLGTLLIVGIPLGSLIMFLALFIRAIFYALIAHLFLRFTSQAWSIKKLTRIAIVANTPSLVVSVLLTIMSLQYSLTPQAQFLVRSISMSYFVFFVICCTQYNRDNNSS